MTVTAVEPQAEVPATPPNEVVGRSPGAIAWARFRRDRLSLVAGILSVLILLAAFSAPLVVALVGVDPLTLYKDTLTDTGLPVGSLGGISWSHPFGVEPGTGRDLFARLVYGSRISLSVAAITTFLTVVIGLVIGVISGYVGGFVDAATGRIIDFLLAFPGFFFLIAMSAAAIQRIEATGLLQGNAARLFYLVAVLTFFGWTYLARLIRGQVLSLREREFVQAAEALGAPRRRIIFKELIPNLWAPVIVYVSLTLPGYLAAEAALSFLGIGVQPPAATWGSILSDSLQYIQQIPSFFLIPGGLLFFVVLCFNLLGDGIRDALDPKGGR